MYALGERIVLYYDEHIQQQRSCERSDQDSDILRDERVRHFRVVDAHLLTQCDDGGRDDGVRETLK